MKLTIAFALALALAGCGAQVPELQTRLVTVPSAKPYRFITYDDKTPDTVAKQIRRHNRTHQAVIEAEKAAKP
jgi:hypothetical protein